ncbi:restriction endonuclease subunit S, partial [Bifidobacterium adolescentis]
MRTRSEINSTEWFGHIPNGWEMRPIKALFRFSKGLSITKADLSECGAPVISYGQIHSKDYDGTGITESLIRYVPKSIAQSSNSSYVKHGGFIFADTSEDLAGVGNCAYNDGNEDLFGGYHTIVANPLLSSENKYFAYLFRTDAWRKQLRKQLVDVKLFSVNQSILGESY